MADDGNAMAECVFPEDIMASILTRLPVKSILRFKSVCKPWFNLFSTPHFIKMHHHHFSTHPKNETVVIYSVCDKSHHTISLFNIDSDKNPTNLDHPFFEYFVGCVNGLVCLAMPPYGQWIELWNPALKLSKHLPLPKFPHGKGNEVLLGFGYDADGDDFKAVRVVHFLDKNKNSKNGVEVYSANSDSWTTIDVGFDFHVLGTRTLAVLNGNPYWAAEVDENEIHNSGIFVCYFDMTKMVFNVVSLSSLNCRVVEDSAFVDWNGSLAVLKPDTKDKRVHSVNVRVFDDVNKIWTLKHTFGPIELKARWLLQWSKNGKILGECSDGKLFVFDSLNGCVKEFVIDGGQNYSYHVCGYAESLSCIKGMEKVVVTKRW